MYRFYISRKSNFWPRILSMLEQSQYKYSSAALASEDTINEIDEFFPDERPLYFTDNELEFKNGSLALIATKMASEQNSINAAVQIITHFEGLSDFPKDAIDEVSAGFANGIHQNYDKFQ